MTPGVPRERIGFKRHLRAEVVAGDAVYLFSERGVTAPGVQATDCMLAWAKAKRSAFATVTIASGTASMARRVTIFASPFPGGRRLGKRENSSGCMRFECLNDPRKGQPAFSN